MKIELGYTLSNFIDYIKTTNEENEIMSKLGYIYTYKMLLEMRINKAMFIGENPIFKGRQMTIWKSIEDDSLGFKTVKVSDGADLLEFYEDGSITYMDIENVEYDVVTLHDLFEASKGKLKLNIKL